MWLPGRPNGGMENKLDIVIEIVTKAQKDLDDLKARVASLEPELNAVASGATGASMSFGSMAAAMGVGVISANAIENALGRVKDIALDLGKAILDLGMQAASIDELEFATDVLSARMGYNNKIVRDTVDGMTNLNISRKQSLMLTNEFLRAEMDLAQAHKLVRSTQDLAVVAQMDSAEALGMVARAVRTSNTAYLNQLVDLPNLAFLYNNYAASLGKTSSELTELERRQVIVNAILNEGEKVAGLYELSLSGASKASRSLESSIQRSGEMVGQVFTPALDAVIPAVLNMAKEFENFLTDNEEQLVRAGQVIGEYAKAAVDAINTFIKNVNWVAVAQIAGAIVDKLAHVYHGAMQVYEIFKLVVQGLTALGQAALGLAQAAGAAVQGNLNLAKASLQTTWEALAETQEKAQSTLKSFWEHGELGAGSFVERFKVKMGEMPGITSRSVNLAAANLDRGFDKMSKDAQEKIKKLVDKIEDEMKRFADSARKATAAFEDRLETAIRRHIDSIKDLRTEISELNRDFAEGAAERLETHEERVQDIKDKYDEELDGLRLNLKRQLSARHVADEDLVRIMEARIAEIETKRDEEIAKEEEKFKKQEEKEKLHHERRLAKIQAKLNEELEIQQRHQADFDRIKDKAVEDDITRLKNAFAAEMEERRRQHEERLAELKKEYDEIAKVKATGGTGIASRTKTSAGSTTSVNKGEPKPNYIPNNTHALSPGGGWRFTSGNGWVRALKGNILPGRGPIPLMAHGGETILTPRQTRGLLKILEDMADGGGGSQSRPIQVTMNNQISKEVDLEGSLRELGWRLAIL